MCNDERNKFCYRYLGFNLENRCISCWSGWIFGLSGVILMIVLLAISIKDVQENEMAIPYHQLSCDVGNIVEAGKRAYPPDTELYTYDRKFVDNNLDLQCVSADGLLIHLIVVQQYRILKTELYEIFFNFGGQNSLDSYVDTISQGIVRNVCAAYKGEEFFSMRGGIELDMINNITKGLQESRSHVQPGFVQLKNIGLPNDLLNAIQSKQVALEDVDVANNERAQKIIQARTREQSAKLDAQIVLDKARADAASINIQAQQKSNARLIEWAERAKAFIIDLEALNIPADEYVDKFLFVRLLSRTLSPIQQACLQSCPPNTACWYCFNNASPAVTI